MTQGEKELGAIVVIVLGMVLGVALIWLNWRQESERNGWIEAGFCKADAVMWVDQPPIVHRDSDGSVSWLQPRDPVLKEHWACENGQQFWRKARPGARER